MRICDKSIKLKAKVIFITGGQRSGKSSFAQKTALQLSENPVYMATAREWDEDFKQRIDRHKSDRDSRWTNIEEEKLLSSHSLDGKVVVVDCITLWLTNFFHDHRQDYESALLEATEEWNNLLCKDCTIIAVSNELGSGLHGSTEAARKFTDLQGRVNQHIAQNAVEVYLMVAGIALKIKGQPG